MEKDTIHSYIPNSVNLGCAIASRHFLLRNRRLRNVTRAGIVCCANRGSANVPPEETTGTETERRGSRKRRFECIERSCIFFSFSLSLSLSLCLSLLSFMVSPLWQSAGGIKRRDGAIIVAPGTRVSDRFVHGRGK